MNLPTSIQDELGIIGCCLLGGLDTAIDAVESVNPEAFFDTELRKVYSVIESMATQGREINTYTLAQRWSEQHLGPLPERIFQAEGAAPSSANLPYHISGLAEAWRKRRLIEGATEILNQAQDLRVKSEDIVAAAETFLYAEEVKSVPIISGKEGAKLLLSDLERRMQLQGHLSGVPTGFYRFDQMTDGLQFGEQTIIGARPSMGKTALGCNIAAHACLKNQIPTAFVSLEMSAAALERRLVSGWFSIPMGEIRKGSYTESRMSNFASFAGLLSKSTLQIIDGVRGLDVNKLCACIRRTIRKHGCRLVIIDYLQKIRPAERHEKRTYEVGEVSGALRALAISTGAAFLTLAQLNRESEKDKGRPPRLADLADSGQIERDADCVALIHRDRKKKEGDAQLIIAKQRDGETGLIDLYFRGQFCRFENPAYGSEDNRSNTDESDD